MSAPLVSCIVPTYQYGHFLPRAIDSALAQDWPQRSLEIVVVDDGSTDDTPAVVRRYGDRVRSIRRPNGGVVAAINDGLAAASGDYVALLSGDDMWPVDRVSRQAPVLQARPELGLLYGDMEVIDADDRRIAPSFFASCDVVPHRGRVLGPLLGSNFVSGGSSMFRRALGDRYFPIPADAVWEDWWLAIRIAECAEIDYLAEPVYRYRLHGANMNLGATGARLVELKRRELPFRRWMLQGNVDLDAVELAEAAWAMARLEMDAGCVADQDGAWMAEVLPVSAEDRRRAEEAVGGAAAGPQAVRALAWDPFSRGAHDAFAAVCGRPSPVRPLETRRHATLALLPDLLRDPSPLARYPYTEGDDATLVLYAPSVEPRVAAEVAGGLLDLVKVQADVLVVAEPRELIREAGLLERADAVLGPRTEAVWRPAALAA